MTVIDIDNVDLVPLRGAQVQDEPAGLAHAVLTDRKMISAATKKRLAPIIGKYIS